MQSLTAEIINHRYNLRFSRLYLYCEIATHFLIVVFILSYQDDWIGRLLLILAVLLSVRYFSKNSIVYQYDRDTAIEIRMNPLRLICYHQGRQETFVTGQISFRFTRWFLVLKLVNSSTRIERVLLRDSFDSPADYSAFRRFLSGIDDAG